MYSLEVDELPCAEFLKISANYLMGMLFFACIRGKASESQTIPLETGYSLEKYVLSCHRRLGGELSFTLIHDYVGAILRGF